MTQQQQTIERQLNQERAKLYNCRQCQAVLGVVQHDPYARLSVFRELVRSAELTIEYVREIKHYALINLDAGTIVCGWCGARLIWRMGEQAIEELLERRAKRTFGLEGKDG